MSEEKQGVTGTVGGWIKAAITSVIGLLSGAFIMYLTPVVNNAIKPAKPVSNFATQVTGLSVQIDNRSTGGVQGWWDFGDGAALEPFDPKLETIKHAYAKPGTYSVKLSLANLLGEESDRIASVSIDADSAALKPEIASFELRPLSDNRGRAPAVYTLSSKVKNSNYCILSLGDSRPTEIIDDANQVRYIAFEEMGSYTVRFAAVNGKQLVEKTQTIVVGASDSSEPMAKLHVTYQAVRVERFTKPERIYCGWHADTKQTVSPFRKERSVDSDCKIVSAELVNKDDKNPSVRNVKWEVAPDKLKIVVTGELVRSTGPLAANGLPPHWVAEFKVVTERRSPPQTINRGHIAMAVNFNTTMKLPLQPLGDGYEIVGKQVSLQLWDGRHKVWETSKAATNAQVALNGKTYRVTALPQNDSFVLTVAQPGPVVIPAVFERNQFLPKKIGS